MVLLSANRRQMSYTPVLSSLDADLRSGFSIEMKPFRIYATGNSVSPCKARYQKAC
jgi:hypothetical protein